MIMNAFLNSQRQLRNGWWIVIFLLMLASLLVPALIIAQQYNVKVTMGLQAILIGVTSFACQMLRRKPLAELLGKLDLRWFQELSLGVLVGAALMLIPALILGIVGWVQWQWNPEGVSVLLPSLLFFAEVAIAEELLFRGFVFQRLLAGLGQWPAQLITATFFLLTHLNNPGMTGSVKIMASTNIFLASVLFGLAFIRTRRLAMPFGLHWMANWVQGGILGFGVSGTEQFGLLRPIFSEAPAWLTGGQFGLEASAPGLICLIVIVLVLNKWKSKVADDLGTVDVEDEQAGDL